MGNLSRSFYSSKWSLCFKEYPSLQSKFTLLKSKFFPAKIPFSKIQKKILVGKNLLCKVPCFKTSVWPKSPHHSNIQMNFPPFSQFSFTRFTIPKTIEIYLSSIYSSRIFFWLQWRIKKKLFLFCDKKLWNIKRGFESISVFFFLIISSLAMNFITLLFYFIHFDKMTNIKASIFRFNFFQSALIKNTLEISFPFPNREIRIKFLRENIRIVFKYWIPIDI